MSPNQPQNTMKRDHAQNDVEDAQSKSEAISNKFKWGISSMKAKAKVASWNPRKGDQSISGGRESSEGDHQSPDIAELPIADSMEQHPQTSAITASSPFEDEGIYSGPEYVYNPAVGGLAKRRPIEDNTTNDHDLSFDSNIAEADTFFVEHDDSHDPPPAPNLTRRPVNISPNYRQNAMTSKAKEPITDAQAQLVQIENDVLRAIMDHHPELKGPGPGTGYASPEETVAAILAKYGQLATSVRNLHGQSDQPGRLRKDHVKAQDDLRGSNTKLQSKVFEKERENKELKLRFEGEIKELKQRAQRESDRLSSEISSLKFQKKELESSHGSKLRSEKRSLESENEKLKTSYEGLLRRMREDAIEARNEANKQNDRWNRTMQELKTRLDKDNSMWSQAYQKLEGIKLNLENELKNVKLAEQRRVDAVVDEWNKKLVKEQRKYDELVKKLGSEIDHLKNSLAEERSHKQKELLTQKKELMEKYEEEEVKLRTVIEEFKVSSAKREQFKGLTDSEVAAQYKRLANNIEDFSRLEWEFRKEGDWPFSEDRLRQLGKNTRKLKQQIIQNCLWMLLYDNIFCSPFRILGINEHEYDDRWIQIYSSGKR
jgi:hypothetical protein